MKKLVLAFVVATAACGGGDTTPDAPVTPPDVSGPPRETFTGSQLLRSQELVEALMVGGTADRAIIRLSAPLSELDWNIHAHPSGTTITVYEELNVMTAEYDFVPSEQADWYLLLRNSGNIDMEVMVEADLYGEMSFGFL